MTDIHEDDDDLTRHELELIDNVVDAANRQPIMTRLELARAMITSRFGDAGTFSGNTPRDAVAIIVVEILDSVMDELPKVVSRKTLAKLRTPDL